MIRDSVTYPCNQTLGLCSCTSVDDEADVADLKVVYILVQQLWRHKGQRLRVLAHVHWWTMTSSLSSSWDCGSRSVWIGSEISAAWRRAAVEYSLLIPSESRMGGRGEVAHGIDGEEKSQHMRSIPIDPSSPHGGTHYSLEEGGGTLHQITEVGLNVGSRHQGWGTDQGHGLAGHAIWPKP
jgi:hypothetical protein